MDTNKSTALNQAGEMASQNAGIVTSAGISAGLDMSLHLVARLESEELAVRTARQMDYDWQRCITVSPPQSDTT